MRWQQGQWSEERILAAVNESDEFRAIPYGRSQVSDPTASSAELDAYWEAYTAIESVGKRPDLLVLRKDDWMNLLPLLDRLEDPTLSPDADLAPVLDKAICGIEAENSLWVGGKMPDYGRHEITRINFVAPTIILKDEDVAPLVAWQRHFGVPICIVQVFFDEAFIATLDQIRSAVQSTDRLESKLTKDRLGKKEIRRKSLSQQKEQGVIHETHTYHDARGGSTKKLIYRMHHTRARVFGRLDEADSPTAVPKMMVDGNGRIMPFVAFQGGRLVLEQDGLSLLRTLAEYRPDS